MYAGSRFAVHGVRKKERRKMLVAAAQLTAAPDPQENLAKAHLAVDQASARGARLIVFPELFLAWIPNYKEPGAFRAVAQPLDGPFVTGLAEAARVSGLWIICGVIEKIADSADRVHNTTVVLDDQGELVALYRKTHLFDAFGYQESRVIAPGDRLFDPVPTPAGCIGLFVCYELRFPEVARHQAVRGAEVLVVPSAWFTGPMKEQHWRYLAVARAIENTAYVIAADQVGPTFLGRSLMVDPMGVVLAEGTEAEGLIYADVDPERVAAVRRKIPALHQRRTDLGA
jgi:predicted amidohydrolase